MPAVRTSFSGDHDSADDESTDEIGVRDDGETGAPTLACPSLDGTASGTACVAAAPLEAPTSISVKLDPGAEEVALPSVESLGRACAKRDMPRVEGVLLADWMAMGTLSL